MPLEKISTSHLPEFHRRWLPRYELPRTSQRLISYLCDRDAGMSGLAVLCSENPAIPALLSREFDSRTPAHASELRTTEFYVSRLGLETVRQVVLEHQLGRKMEFPSAREFLERIDTSASRIAYTDSAFIAGLVWDLLDRESLSGRQKTWVESRLDLAFEHLEAAIRIAEEEGGFPAKRWLAGCLSAASVIDAIAGLEDATFIEQVLAWERRKVPTVVQALLKSRHLGFSTCAAGAWICERIDVLRPMADAVRYLDAPQALRGASIELRKMAEILGRATEMS
jgi:hypothetical protein